MVSTTCAAVKEAIDQYLNDSLQTKLEPELKKREKVEPGSDQAQKAEEEIAKLRERFSKPVWLEQAANTMAKQLKFGTHISKGIHPDSKGDSINFRSEYPLPEGIVGSQLLTNPELDASGNAAALPLATFFNSDVNDTRLRDLILADHPALEGAFADDLKLSLQYQQAFYKALAGETEQPATHERNKQLLWPMAEAKTHDNYHCLIPLSPSALTHNVFRKVDHRFSEENKTARENRKKKTIEQK
ncbi:MAG: type I-F CRISPR-associated protein Csy1, partial [Endozoicomonas sp.]